MPPINQNEHWPQTTIMAVELICADFNFISSVSHGLSSEQIEVNVTLKERTESEMSPDFQEENRIMLTKRKTNGWVMLGTKSNPRSKLHGSENVQLPNNTNELTVLLDMLSIINAYHEVWRI